MPENTPLVSAAGRPLRSNLSRTFADRAMMEPEQAQAILEQGCAFIDEEPICILSDRTKVVHSCKSSKLKAYI